MISKEDAFLNFQTMTAEEIHHKVRGLACGPKPRTTLCLNGKKELLQILRTELPTNSYTCQESAGAILSVESKKGFLVKCKQGNIWITEVHPAGKKPMSAAAFANGRGLKPAEGVFVCND